MKWIELLRNNLRLRSGVDAALTIEYSGQKTKEPKVHVSACGRYPGGFGAMSVFTFPKTPVGEARAEMAAKDLGRILGVRVVDRRKEK